MRVVDGLQIERTGSRGDICTARQAGDLAQRLAVEAGLDRATLGVAEQAAGAGLPVQERDLAPRFRAQPDRDDGDSAFRRLARGIQRELVLVLPVGDQQQGT